MIDNELDNSSKYLLASDIPIKSRNIAVTGTTPAEPNLITHVMIDFVTATLVHCVVHITSCDYDEA